MARRQLQVDDSRSSTQEAARTHKHNSIGTEHLLLGLLGEPRGLAHELPTAKAGSEQRIRVEKSPAAQILRNLGFTSDELREAVKTYIVAQSSAPKLS